MKIISIKDIIYELPTTIKENKIPAGVVVIGILLMIYDMGIYTTAVVLISMLFAFLVLPIILFSIINWGK